MTQAGGLPAIATKGGGAQQPPEKLTLPAADPPIGGFILASGSPRREKLLREAGYQFQVEPSKVDEENERGDRGPSDLAMHLALLKAQAVWRHFPDAVVLGADTVVAFGERIIGKPKDEKDARGMLYLLAGTTHLVITGVAIVRRNPDMSPVTRVMSAVRMRDFRAMKWSDIWRRGIGREKPADMGFRIPIRLWRD